MANLFARHEGESVIEPMDFFEPRVGDKQSWQEQLRRVEVLNVMFRGEDLREKK